MTSDQIKKIQKILSEKKQLLKQGIQSMSKDALTQSQRDSTGESSGYTYHMADVATDNYDRDFAMEMVTSEQRLVWEIEEALQRIRDKSYGICEKCSKKIAYKRLEAVPYARCCLSCQSQEEGPRRALRPQKTQKKKIAKKKK